MNSGVGPMNRYLPCAWITITGFSLLGCGIEIADTSRTCAAEAQDYVLYVMSATSAEIVHFAIGDHAIFVAPGTVRVVEDESMSKDGLQQLKISHEANPSTQGMGTIEYTIPRVANAGLLAIDVTGTAWLHFVNPIEESIEFVELETADGETISPFFNGMNGRFLLPLEPKVELFLVGLPALDYKKVRFQTVYGQIGEFSL